MREWTCDVNACTIMRMNYDALTACAVTTDRTRRKTRRTRITVGGDRLQCSGETATPTASMTTTKIHLNSTIPTESVRHCTADIKDFYLNSKLDDYECLFIDSHLTPPQFTQDYELSAITKMQKC